MKFLNASFVGLQNQSASHMPTSNRFSVQNQWPMAKLKFFLKEVYTSGMLALEIMSKKSAVEQYRSLCKKQEKNNFSSVIDEKVDAQLLYLITWKSQGQENLSKLQQSVFKHSEGREREGVSGKTSFPTRKQGPGHDSFIHGS